MLAVSISFISSSFCRSFYGFLSKKIHLQWITKHYANSEAYLTLIWTLQILLQILIKHWLWKYAYWLKRSPVPSFFVDPGFEVSSNFDVYYMLTSEDPTHVAHLWPVRHSELRILWQIINKIKLLESMIHNLYFW